MNVRSSKERIKKNKLDKINIQLVKLGIKPPSTQEENALLARQAHIRI